MSVSSMMAIRRRILGVALRTARSSRDRTIEELAKVLQCAPERVSGYERGEEDISMPELEALAVYLHVPTQSLLSGELSPDDDKEVQTPHVRKLRDRIIGTLVRKARLGAAKSLDDTVARLGCTVEEYEAYERGQAPVSVARLLVLAEFLDVPWEELAGQTLAERPAEDSGIPTETGAAMEHLSAEMLAFLSDPMHLPYVNAAMALSRVAKDELGLLTEALMVVGVHDSSDAPSPGL